MKLYHELDEKDIFENNFNDDIADCYYDLNQYDKALFWYKRHFDQNPNHIWGCIQISNMYNNMKQYKAAYKHLNSALCLADNDDDKLILYKALARNCYLNNNIDEAIKYTKRVFKFDISIHKTAIPLNNLGKYYCKKREYKEGYKCLCKAIKIDSETPDINGNFGIVLYHLHRINESIIYLEKCINGGDKCDDPEVIIDCLYVYGLILFQQCKYNESIQKLEKILNRNNYREWNQYRKKEKIYCLMTNAMKMAQKLNPYRMQHIDDIQLLLTNHHDV